MKRKILMILLCLTLLVGVAGCEKEKSGLIVGQVVDGYNIPISNVKITVGEEMATTNELGKFKIVAKEGNQTITALKEGVSLTEEVTVIAKEKVEVKLSLILKEEEATAKAEKEESKEKVTKEETKQKTDIESDLAYIAAPPIPEGHIRLHYLRNDREYEGWGLHLWGAGYNGSTVDWGSPVVFDGIHDYGVYWDIPYNQGEGDLNFIIHRGNEKDPNPDRKYPNPDENREIFSVTGDETAYLTLEAALDALGKDKLAIQPIPDNHVRLHYHRFDKNYEGWGLHLWGEGYSGDTVDWGAPVEPVGHDTFGAYWDIPISDTGDLNFIIHNGVNKDPDGDRIYSNPQANREVWSVSGDATVYQSRLEAFKSMSNDIVSATIVAPKEIQVRFKAPIKEAIWIKDGKQVVPLAKLETEKAPLYNIKLRDKLDLNTTYKVVCGDLNATATLSPEVIDQMYDYTGQLGNFYSPEATSFKLWAPLTSDVKLLLYNDCKDLEPVKTLAMERGEEGLWSLTVEEDLEGKFYQYQVTNRGETKKVLDPYAKSMAGFNSNGSDKVGKGAIVDLAKTNPVDWDQDSYVKVDDQEDVIIYEMSVRDFTIADNSGVSEEKRGTYLGFIEKIPHLMEMGITHVQLQPVQNFYYGNEFDKSYEEIGSEGEANYNWGYDPHNYNTPEGWYASNPADPYNRIEELKELIKALHDANIGVVLDVVYNHTAITDSLEDIVPGYYYRRDNQGNFTSGSGCGNDTTSERKMWRKFMIESTQYWVEEYHIDGFRFDLMGLHDETTMNKLANNLREINPDIVLHGEGWNMGTLPEEDRYIKASNQNHTLLEVEKGIAVFNDTIRDAMKHEYYASPLEEGGFLQTANREKEALIRSGIIAGMVDYHSDVAVDDGSYNRFADDPEETITYVNCHDGYTIWDKINNSTPDYSKEERIQVNKLAAAMILTAQGKPFLHGGEEMLRSKPDPDNEEHGVDHNSYDSGDITNEIDWDRKEEYSDVVDYYKGLIELRSSHQAFRMETMEEIQQGLTFIDEDIDYLLGFKLEEQDGEDDWKEIVVIHNANREAKTLEVSGVDSSWKVVVDGQKAGTEILEDTEVELATNSVKVPAISTVVIYK